MTTLKDMIRDIVKEVLEAQEEASRDAQVISEQGIEDIIDEGLENIKKRLIGE